MRLKERLKRLVPGRAPVAGSADRPVELEAALRRSQAEVRRLNRVLELAGQNPRILWLYANRQERMDANLDFFEESRRRFHLARYEFAAPRVAGKSVADIASGTGYGCAHHREQGGARDVVGVDIDPEAVEYARETYGRPGVRFVCASGAATGLPDAAVDVVTSFETIEHFEQPESLVREFARILRPGGLLVVSTPNAWAGAETAHHQQSFSWDSLAAVLSERFEVRERFNQNSGSATPYNRGQPAGIVPATAANAALAECLLCVCRLK